MISIKKLTKKYSDNAGINKINLELPRNGLIIIYGQSGCGKTTLLNCIAGLLDFEGSISIDNKEIGKLNDKELSEFRLKYLGFIFQDFKLFENDNVFENISLPMKTLTNFSDRKIKRKVSDLLEIVDLKKYEKRMISSLSGGEKQRVCIARSLINNPKIILADEPTGSLDTNNGEAIMSLLSKISNDALVIIVSHDRELTEKYGDEIIEMEDGAIKKLKFKRTNKDSSLALENLSFTNKKPSVPFNFFFKHTINGFNNNKIRNSICNVITSLGLIGVGLSISLSTSISKNIKESYKSLIKDTSLSVQLKKESDLLFKRIPGSYLEAKSVEENLADDINYVGVTYQNNFETMFIDENYAFVECENRIEKFDDISARNINEFVLLDECVSNILPGKVDSLKNDEIVIGLNINQIRKFCYALRIEKTAEELSYYLTKHDLFLIFNFGNISWSYSDQHIFQIKGFTLETECKIYHSNPLWNEVIFEEQMRLPTTENHKQSDYPWVLNKLTYFNVDNVEKFLKDFDQLESADEYMLDIAGQYYFPNLYRLKDISEINRIIFLMNSRNTISNKYISYFNEVDQNIKNPMLTNLGGYCNFPNNFMSGFANMTYFSFDENLMNEVLEAHSSIRLNDGEKEELPKEILCGHFSKIFDNCVSFKVLNEKLLSGSYPKDYSEIVISKGLLNSLSDVDLNTDHLILASTLNEIDEQNGINKREYKIVKLKISGIVDSDDYNIYHDGYWSKYFYQCKIGIPAEYLLTTGISYSLVDENKSKDSITKLQRAFPQFDIINPLNDINENIDDVCKKLTITISLISLISLIISLILLCECNYLYVSDYKKEIGLARCLGINKKESKKFLYYHSIITCLFSFLLSSIELVVINFITSKVIATTLHNQTTFSFNPLSILIMLILALVISLFSSAILNKEIVSIDPIEVLKM